MVSLLEIGVGVGVGMDGSISLEDTFADCLMGNLGRQKEIAEEGALCFKVLCKAR